MLNMNTPAKKTPKTFPRPKIAYHPFPLRILGRVYEQMIHAGIKRGEVNNYINEAILEKLEREASHPSP